MKKLVVTGILSVGTLVGANLPGLEIISANAAIPSDTSISKINNNQENLLEQQREKRSGTVIKKTEYGVLVSNNKSGIWVKVSPEVLQNINVGDTVNVYASTFFSTLVPGSPINAANPIIQKNGEEGALEKQYEKRSGTVIKKTEYGVLVSNNKSGIWVKVSPEVLQNINVGDTVNVYASTFFSTLVPGNPINAVNPIIKKINKKETMSNPKEKQDPNTKLIEQENKQSADFITGQVVSANSDHVVVKYDDNKMVFVELSKGQKFNRGDQVRVSDLKNWKTQSSGAVVVQDSIIKITL